MEYQDGLGISREAFDSLREHFERRSHEGRDYWHLPDYYGELNRGTVVMDGHVVDGWPKIPRTLVLSAGVPEQFDDEIAVEEKLDGYNVRIAKLPSDDRPLAFTRSGIVCPFTTYKARELLNLAAFFEDHPDRTICAEAVGPENPYTVHDYPDVDSFDFRVFAIRDRESGDPVGVPERRATCREYDLPQVPLEGYFGVDRAVEELPAIVDDLDDRGREGVVLKDLAGTTQLKYTTSAANQGDLAYAFSLPFDYGQSFMFRRIIREAFQSVEWDEDDETLEARSQDLGEAILTSMVETVRTVDRGGHVGERHTVRAPPEVVDSLLDHLRDQGLKLEIVDDDADGEDRVLTFEKRTQATNDKTAAYLDGQIVRE